MTGIIEIEITRARARMITTGTAAETTSGLKDVMTGVMTGASLQLEIRIKEIKTRGTNVTTDNKLEGMMQRRSQKSPRKLELHLQVRLHS